MKKLIEYARKYNIKLVCTNDVHFVDEENAEAHDRLICLSTGKDLDDPNRMLYTKQEWMKTREEMNEIFADVPEALSNTVEICDKVEFYSIDHAPIMPTFAIPEDFGTEEEYRRKFTEKDLFDEFTRDENGNVVMDEAAARQRLSVWADMRNCIVSSWRRTTWPNWLTTERNGVMVRTCRKRCRNVSSLNCIS